MNEQLIKEYIKENLKLEVRYSYEGLGDRYQCIIVELKLGDEVISEIGLPGKNR